MKNLKFLSVCVALTMLFSACNRDLLDQDEGGVKGGKTSSKCYTVKSSVPSSSGKYTAFAGKEYKSIKDGIVFQKGKLVLDADAELGTYKVAFYDDDQKYWEQEIIVEGLPCNVSLVSTGQNNGNNAVKAKILTPDDLRPYWRVWFLPANGVGNRIENIYGEGKEFFEVPKDFKIGGKLIDLEPRYINPEKGDRDYCEQAMWSFVWKYYASGVLNPDVNPGPWNIDECDKFDTNHPNLWGIRTVKTPVKEVFIKSGGDYCIGSDIEIYFQTVTKTVDMAVWDTGFDSEGPRIPHGLGYDAPGEVGLTIECGHLLSEYTPTLLTHPFIGLPLPSGYQLSGLWKIFDEVGTLIETVDPAEYVIKPSTFQVQPDVEKTGYRAKFFHPVTGTLVGSATLPIGDICMDNWGKLFGAIADKDPAIHQDKWGMTSCDEFIGYYEYTPAPGGGLGTVSAEPWVIPYGPCREVNGDLNLVPQFKKITFTVQFYQVDGSTPAEFNLAPYKQTVDCGGLINLGGFVQPGCYDLACAYPTDAEFWGIADPKEWDVTWYIKGTTTVFTGWGVPVTSDLHLIPGERVKMCTIKFLDLNDVVKHSFQCAKGTYLSNTKISGIYTLTNPFPYGTLSTPANKEAWGFLECQEFDYWVDQDDNPILGEWDDVLVNGDMSFTPIVTPETCTVTILCIEPTIDLLQIVPIGSNLSDFFNDDTAIVPFIIHYSDGSSEEKMIEFNTRGKTNGALFEYEGQIVAKFNKVGGVFTPGADWSLEFYSNCE